LPEMLGDVRARIPRNMGDDRTVAARFTIVGSPCVGIVLEILETKLNSNTSATTFHAYDGVQFSRYAVDRVFYVS
jgi:hypothetical protein